MIIIHQDGSAGSAQRSAEPLFTKGLIQVFHVISVFSGTELKMVFMPADQYTAAEALEAVKEQYPNKIVSYERSVMT